MPVIARLSDRELEIVRKIAAGHTSREIGTMLTISAHTVQAHRKNIMQKMKVRKCTEVVAICMKLRWI